MVACRVVCKVVGATSSVGFKV